MKRISLSVQSLECIRKLHTPNNQHSSTTNNEGKFSGSADIFIQCKLISSSLSHRSDYLPRAVPTFYDHFPKPRRGVRPTGFRRAGWRRCNPTLIGRCRRGRRKVPPGNTATLNVFTCACTIRYHAVVMTVVRSRGRSGYRASLCSSRYSSVVE